MFKITAILLALTLVGFQGAGEVTGKDLVKLAIEFVDLKSKVESCKGSSIEKIELEIKSLQKTIDDENGVSHPNWYNITNCENAINNLKEKKANITELRANTERMNAIQPQLTGREEEIKVALLERSPEIKTELSKLKGFEIDFKKFNSLINEENKLPNTLNYYLAQIARINHAQQEQRTQ